VIKKMRAKYPGFIVTIRCQQGNLGLVWSAVHVKERMWNWSFDLLKPTGYVMHQQV